MTATPVEVGGTYWLVTRERVRAGKGPRKVTITELAHTTQGGVRLPTLAYAGKTLVSVSNLHDTEKAARMACRGIVSAEWGLEDGRAKAIKTRLRAAWEACNKKT